MTAEGGSDRSVFYPQTAQCGGAATEASFRLRRAGRGECKREGVRGNGRKGFPTIRGRRPRLHRTRFLIKFGPAFPDEKPSVEPRPPAADHLASVTARGPFDGHHDFDRGVRWSRG